LDIKIVIIKTDPHPHHLPKRVRVRLTNLKKDLEGAYVMVAFALKRIPIPNTQ
jgi:hypothetical protein